MSVTFAPTNFVNLFHCLLGLVGDNCKDESAEKCDAEAGGQHDVARSKGGFEFGFGFVGHGWWVYGLKEKNVRWRAAPLGEVNKLL